jgi:hypothetical protein
VVAAVAQRLVNVGRIAAAADLQEGMNDIAGKTNLASIQSITVRIGAFRAGQTPIRVLTSLYTPFTAQRLWYHWQGCGAGTFVS